MQVQEIMTREVKKIGPEASVQEAAKKMNRFNTGCLIVVKKNLLKGILTERDIMRRVVSENRSASKTKISEVMTKNVIYIEPELEIEEAVEIMTSKKIKKLPIVHKNRLIGIVTVVDIANAQPKMMEQLAKLVLLPTKRKLAAG